MTQKIPVLPQKSYILPYKKPYEETMCDPNFPTAIGHPLYFAPPKSPTSPQQSSVSSPKSPTTLQNSPILLQNSPISRERALGCSPYVTLIVARFTPVLANILKSQFDNLFTQYIWQKPQKRAPMPIYRRKRALLLPQKSHIFSKVTETVSLHDVFSKADFWEGLPAVFY